MWGSFGFVCFFFSSSWNVPGSNIFRLLCESVRTLRVYSLALVSIHSSTEVLISYPEKLLTIGLEILFLEKWMRFNKEGLKELSVSTSVFSNAFLLQEGGNIRGLTGAVADF